MATVIDASGSGNNGATSGSVTFPSPGKVGGNYAELEVSASSYINCGNTDGIFDFAADESFSYGCWFRTNSSGSLRSMIMKQGTSGALFQLLLESVSNRVQFGLVDDSAHSNSQLTVGAYNDGDWHLAICIIDRGTDLASLYVDNGHVGSFGISLFGAISNPGVNLFVGARDAGSPDRFWSGDLDEVFVVRYALTTDDVAALWNNGNGKRIRPL